MVFKPPLTSLILALYLLLAILYSLVVPVFEGPDESAHYLYADYLARTNRLPKLDYAQPVEEYHQPPLYYWLNSVWIRLVGRPDPGPFLQRNPFAAISDTASPANKNAFRHNLMAERWPWPGTVLALRLGRLTAMLMGALTVWLAGRIGLSIFAGDEWLAGAVAGLVAFNPQFIFISANLNNDNLVTLLVTAGLWLAWRYSQTPALNWRHGLWAGLLVGLAVLSKPTGWIGGPALGAVFCWQVVKTRSGRPLYGLLAMLLSGLLVAGWWIVRNHLLYQDPFLRRYLMAYLQIEAMQPLSLALFLRRLQEAEISFWATFGWLNITIPERFYTIYRLMVRLALLGVGLGGIMNRFGRQMDWRDLAGRMVLPGILLGGMGLTMWQWVVLAGGVQGRLLFPIIVPLALLVVWGWQNLLGPKLVWLWPLYSAGVAVWALFLVLKPAYAPPPILSQLPAEASPAAIRFPRPVALIGYQAPESPLRPGYPVELTLFWRAKQPLTSPLAVVLQAVDEQGLVLAQAQGFAGGGILPADQWPGGQIVLDRVVIELPGLTLAPTTGTFQVGLYDPDTDQFLPLADGAVTAPLATFFLQPTSGPFDVNWPVAFEQHISLLGYDLPRQRLTPGELFAVTLHWVADVPVAEDYTVFVHVVDAAGELVAQDDSWPAADRAPTSTWQPGQPVADRHYIFLPPTLASGPYQVQVGLYHAETGWRIPLRPDEALFGADALDLTQIWLE